MATPRNHRASSVSSAGTSRSAVSLSFAPRYMPNPEPQYISRVAAGEHVEQITRNDQYDLGTPSASPVPHDLAIFTESALALLNHFLDALLYNFLAKAHSTLMSKLRVAITDVLKARLARDALLSADEDIQGLIDEAEIDAIEERPQANGSTASQSSVFQLEPTFQVMRLRVMVFIKLGEFNDEDEIRYLGEEAADFSILNGPTAVFLASVLEYIAESLLDTAGEAAWSRSRKKPNKRTPTIRESRELEDIDPDRLVVEETDVEKIALNPMLGRLWRTWRKTYRGMASPSTAASPLMSEFPRSVPGALQSPRRSFRRNSSEYYGDPARNLAEDKRLTLEDVPEGEVSEHDIAANIPLPMTNNDVNEIEVPGLSEEVYDTDEERVAAGPDATNALPKRPTSAMFARDSEEDAAIPTLTRLRSNSAPHLSVGGRFFSRSEALSDVGFVLVSEGEDGEPTMEEVDNVTPKKPDEELTGDESAEILTRAHRPEQHNEPTEGAVDERELSPSEATPDASLAPKEGDENDGLVAGVLTGATAMVSSAVATIAGTRTRKGRQLVEAEAGATKSTEDSAEEEEVTGLPAHRDGLRSHPPQADEPRDRQKSRKEEEEEAAWAPASATAGVAEALAAASAPEKVLPGTGATTTTRDMAMEHLRKQEQDDIDEDDLEAIGVARTSDVKIQSQSPPLTPNQNGFYFSPAHVVEQARDARVSIDQNGISPGMYDEYNLTQQHASGQRHQQHQSREVERPGSVRAVERPLQAPPAVGQVAQRDSSYTAVSDPRRSSKDSTATARAQKAPPPLQTNLQDKDGSGRPPSSTYSTRSSTTTPRSTRGSSSSIQHKNLRVSDEQKERDFDALIATAEPRVFSLTPEHLRDPQLDEVSDFLTLNYAMQGSRHYATSS